MKSLLPLLSLRRVLALGVLIAFAGCATTPPPDTIPEGLVRVKDTQADLVYARPGVDFGKYTEFYLLEPSIAFRADFQGDMNFHGGIATGGMSGSDLQRMIDLGKKLLAEQFDTELAKGGFTLVHAPSARALAVRASISDLYINAPDANDLNGTWGRTYANGAGSATLEIELYDSVSGQLLARAYDEKDDRNTSAAWRFQRDRMSNINDARAAFSDWAQMLVNGLKRAQAAKVPASVNKTAK
ncbi:MAG: DUF3313 family protein [Lacunisphaera sp.]